MKRKIILVTGSIIILIVGIGYIYFNYTPSYTSHFKGPVSKDQPLPTALISGLEKYVKRLMNQIDVSGLSMILFHNDKVNYNRGFGVRDLENRAPVTSQTSFGIALTTKSLTAIVIASLVDDGVIEWNTPLTDILPSFALSDPGITKNMTFRHTLCMSSSYPEHKEAITVEYSDMTAEDVIELLTGREQVYDHQIRQAARDMDRHALSLSLVTRKTEDPKEIVPFLDPYHDDALGDIKLVLHDDRSLWVDFCEYELAIRPMILDENQYIYFESVFLGKTIQMTISSDGTPMLSWSGNENAYVFNPIYK